MVSILLCVFAFALVPRLNVQPMRAMHHFDQSNNSNSNNYGTPYIASLAVASPRSRRVSWSRPSNKLAQSCNARATEHHSVPLYTFQHSAASPAHPRTTPHNTTPSCTTQIRHEQLAPTLTHQCHAEPKKHSHYAKQNTPTCTHRHNSATLLDILGANQQIPNLNCKTILKFTSLIYP